MKKSELVKKVAEKSEISQNLALKTINAVFETLMDSFGRGDSFTMIGFGTFKVVQRSERKGRNPGTGKEITIPAHKTVRFTLAKRVKELMNPKPPKKRARKAPKKAKKK
jgi:DNA-binding protein HU-beta